MRDYLSYLHILLPIRGKEFHSVISFIALFAKLSRLVFVDIFVAVKEGNHSQRNKLFMLQLQS